MNYKRFGKKIRKERLLNEFTQAELAEKSDISYNFLGQIERGERVPSLDTTLNIAKNLNVTVNDLLYGDELCDDAIIYELSLALSKMSNNDKALLTDIIHCFIKRSLNKDS